MNKDQIKGRTDQARGQIKETTGKVVGNENLEEEGKSQKVFGRVQSGFGNLKERLKGSKR